MLISTQTTSLVTQALATHLFQTSISPRFETVSGGSINSCFKVILPGHPNFFLKINDAPVYPQLFECEKTGLECLQQAGVNTPQIIQQFTDNKYQFLLLEWINPGNKTIHFWKKFGEQLAQLHQSSAAQFGFYENNYIGSLRQTNDLNPSWTAFFVDQRLLPQVRLATTKGYLQKKHHLAFEKLFLRLDEFFPAERPSLLHGDLWSGNFLCDEHSSPILIDPAVYFGHRMMDLAMTRLFGGFDNIFYEAYDYHFPFPKNQLEQSDICQLYPLLVHLNLFGLSYLDDIDFILNRYA